ncbi:MAG: GNAT family N-acetyltransferase [Thermodesulfobacteriota bacterium]|nr:GNAT family N-acetyltransferase [Thermodesulfobacteriota bacterium]
MKNLIIRRLNENDADDISRILKAITKDSGTLDYRLVIKEEVKKKDGISFVAEVDGKVVGYMITYVLYGGFGLEKNAWIRLFGVDPKYMGEGIGKSMAGEVFKAFEKINVKHIFTSVKWDSTDLLSFFKSLGFDSSKFVNLVKILD